MHEPSDGIPEELERQLQLALAAATIAARHAVATRQHQVEHPHIARLRVLRRQPRQLRQIQESKRIQPVIHRHDHHVAATGQHSAPARGILGRMLGALEFWR